MKDPADPYALDPMMITQEELDELSKLWEIYNGSTDCGSNPNYHGGPPEWYDEDYHREVKARRKHDYLPTLLVFSTCYTCKHCGAKKEQTTGDHCEEEF